MSLSVCLCVYLCVSVYSRAYLWNRWTDLHEFCLRRSPVAVARFCSGGVAICYVLPVLWMTSRLTSIGGMTMRGKLNLYPTTTSGVESDVYECLVSFLITRTHNV